MLRNGLEPWHLLLVAVVLVLVFGSKKLPDTARALGKSMRILKSEAKAMKAENASASEASSPQQTPVTPRTIQGSTEPVTPAQSVQENGPTASS